jgi:hypothetical protein
MFYLTLLFTFSDKATLNVVQYFAFAHHRITSTADGLNPAVIG